MKKIENNFTVSGFVGKDAEIRQFANASVARFSLAVGRQEKNRRTKQEQSQTCLGYALQEGGSPKGNSEETNRVSAFMNMEAWRKNEHTAPYRQKILLFRAVFLHEIFTCHTCIISPCFIYYHSCICYSFRYI